MFDTTDVQSDPTIIPFSLDNEPPPTQYGNKGDPFRRSMTRAEHASFTYLSKVHGAAMARRLIQFKREKPDERLPRTIKRGRAVAVAERPLVGSWLVGLTSVGVRVVINGTSHDLSSQEATEIQTALARIAA